MKSQKTDLVPAWAFQAIALVLCLTCLIGIMFQLGMFPAKVATFTSEYRNSVTLSSNSVTLIFPMMLLVFWIFLAIKCFRCHSVFGGVGSILQVVSCFSSIYIGIVYAKLINSTMTYEEVMPTIELCNNVGYVDLIFPILGMVFLVIKGGISVALKIGFAAYPIVGLIAVNGLGGYKWYPWIEILYAVALLVLSVREGNNTNKSIQKQ